MTNADLVMRAAEFVDGLTMEELHLVNRVVVDRIRYLHHTRTVAQLASLRIGETVGFCHQGRLIRGRVEKINTKTVCVRSDEHNVWKVSPALLIRQTDAAVPASEGTRQTSLPAPEPGNEP